MFKEFEQRAREILADIEADKPVCKVQRREAPAEFDLFTGITESKESEVADTIRSVDINTLTPIEAMNMLFELKKKLSD